MTQHKQSSKPQSETEQETANQAGFTDDSEHRKASDTGPGDTTGHTAGGSTAEDAEDRSQTDELSESGDSEPFHHEPSSEPEDGSQPAREVELDTQLKDTEARLMRTMADFDNFRRRTRQEQDEMRKFAAKRLLEGLLPVVDNFERALSALDSQEVSDDLRTGVEMVYRQLQTVLSEQGVTQIEAVGEPFNPQFHEAVMQEPADGREGGIVLQELQKGYRLHDKVLRPAMVKVSI